MKSRIYGALALCLLAATSYAHNGHDHGDTVATSETKEVRAEEWTTGEIRKVDLAQGKVTIKHGAIRNLGMDPMTMVFRVREARLLVGLEAGKPIQFKATEAAGVFYLTDWKTVP